jgi:hypothetical protein
VILKTFCDGGRAARNGTGLGTSNYLSRADQKPHAQAWIRRHDEYQD